jgi:hypothetical protein
MTSVEWPSWRLASGTGREKVTWTARAFERSGSEDAITCDVTLAGRYFPASLDARDAGGTPDFHLELRGLAVTISTLERLHDHLTRWLALSPSERSQTGLSVDCDLGSLFDQHIRLLLGERSDTLSAGQPVATLRYVVGRMTGEMWFATDADSLTDFSQQVRAALRWSAR